MRRVGIMVVLFVWGCSGKAPEERPEAAASAPPAAKKVAPDACPADGDAPTPLPGVRPEHQQLDYWMTRVGARHDLDEVLLAPNQVRAHNAALEVPNDKGEALEIDLRAPMPADALKSKVTSRLEWLGEQFTNEKYVESDGQPLTAKARSALALPANWKPGGRELRVATSLIPIRCGPRARGFYTRSLDLAFDRNNCSTARPQEVVEVLGVWPGGMQLARTRYALGWIASDAPLSPPLPADAAAEWVDGPRIQLGAEVTLAGMTLPAGTRLMPVEGGVAVATAKGIVEAPAPGNAALTQRPLTRRAFLTEAFRLLDAAYGWGGENGGRDCSRYTLDVFGAFDIELPRYSGSQAQAGTFNIEIEDIKDEGERVALFESAANRGVVLLHFPGHIMLYLGLDDRGTPMAIHSFAEYLVPCGKDVPTTNEKRETLLRVNRVTLSDLELGRGTSRTAFIERVTHITVVGKAPGVELAGIAQMRPAAPVQIPSDDQCKDVEAYTIFGSPLRPNGDQPLKLIVSGEGEDVPGELAARGPDGVVVRPKLRKLGGPPYAYVGTIDAPAAGAWTIAYGDGENVSGCRKIKVLAGRPRIKDGPAEGPVWRNRNGWGPQMERFYAAFVESLFDYPLEDDRTWSNLHDLLGDAERNLLHDHLSRREDEKLRLVPDCADLPYFLRAYFAWKVGLPMGFRQCNRGRAGRPPRCGELMTNDMPREKVEDMDAVNMFIRRRLKSAVHSSTARTVPKDDETDVYPIPLKREWIRPGTTYADPYGHLLVVTRWLPQGKDGYGVLLAADAQPDGTIGRRRFWRGSFLFSSSTKDSGAGFKAFRPVVRRDGGYAQRTNKELERAKGIAPFSTQMYDGSDDDFYDAMQGLINPRPLDPNKRLLSLVEALHEVVNRRVTAIANGEEFMASRGFRAIDMPSGSSIFLTAGPWEDFSTPSRDMRLLISMHTVVDFPASVGRRPELYGLSAEAGRAAVPQLQAELKKALAARTIEYVKSDGSKRTLTLETVVARRKALEMAYNPNDCIEIRWAEEPGSPAMQTCKRKAPGAQRAKMAKYRPWFAERRRPAR